MLTFPRWILYVSLSLAAFASTGCVTSLKPLSDEKTSTPDVRLLGTWEFEDEEKMEKATIVVTQKKDSPNVLDVVASNEKEKETGELLLTKIGEEHFVSVASKEDDGSVKYTIAKYELTGDDTIKFWGFDTDFFATAVENKELKGTVTQKLFKDVTLDEAPNNLRKFIEKHGAKCFMKETEIVVKRVKKSD